MATYVIGDVHGCVRTLEALVASFGHDPTIDRLWFTGDLVNRGPGSLEVLRWVRGLGERATAVLGNHDLHLLSVSLGVRAARRKDTFQPILAAPDRDELLDWLRQRPVMVRDDDWLLVHAGLRPDWSVARAEQLARDAERALRDAPIQILRQMYREGESPAPVARALRILVSIRTCDSRGVPDFSYTGPPGDAPGRLRPWYEFRSADDVRIVFGHWAALGLHLDRVIGLDTGCAWGGKLTAMRLDDEQIFQVPRIDA
ncbi:MAG: symmetrical bis(5'-nucleosyl)-tetraphosphatase [Planctomycetes bacterium]|nr:symmetrical bis(5'-nucleosyl)-tetraphosphatase [Planctomycetota bacterium]